MYRVRYLGALHEKYPHARQYSHTVSRARVRGRCRYYYQDDAPGARPLGPPAAGGRSPRVA